MKTLLTYLAGMFCFFVIGTSLTYSQENSLIRYDANFNTTDYINSIPIDTIKQYNETDYNLGILDNIADLNLRKSFSHMPGSGFTDVYSASSWLQTNSYPARTIVKLFYYNNGNLHELCSGTIIGEKLVATSAHCIYYYFDEHDTERRWLDSILVIPSYDNSTIDPNIGRTISSTYYIFENWFDEIDLDYDMAFIELKEPIGQKTGWVGVGYSLENNFYTQNTFHNFSYPSAVHPFDSSRIYDGNMMFYSYGELDTVAEYEVGHKVNAIPGQSGSSIIHTDNQSYHLYGVLSNHLYGYGTLFNRITPNKFYAIKNLLENETALIKHDKSTELNSANDEPQPLFDYNFASPESQPIKLNHSDSLLKFRYFENQFLEKEIDF